ncbi:LuxR family transcriptional regulator [Thioclava dalianensis]|uniref:autoinducer binding domain-containing protein n=1 Tax=Thioclava dalianensis TaxID=1185766 RepID=UPI00056DD77A|nr:autoinducer binding domain-containing protein [Thioclava dalianensis]SFN09879.1 LuxR family transcriptional regulator [Thioclava dalianensis]
MSFNRATREMLAELADLSPLGFTVGLHIRHASPLLYHSTFPDAWVAFYNENAFYLRDPLVFWGIGMTGVTRWSEISLPDPFDVIGQAATYGLRFGASTSCGPISSRSMVGIGRGDREFSDQEMLRLQDIAMRLHEENTPSDGLTKPQVEALICISNGDRHAAAAAKLGISESALKARLKSARIRLEARTTSEAVRKAREYRLL